MASGILNMRSFWMPANRSRDTDHAQWTFGRQHGQMQVWSFIYPSAGYIGPTGMLVYGTLINMGCRSFKFMEKLYGSWNSSLPGSRWWRFGDPSLHRFWLIYPCNRRMDGQTDRQTELRWLRCTESSSCFRA